MHSSPWHAANPPTFPVLDGDRKVDTVIIGGGITGLTSAYLLKAAGQRVALLERDRIGDGETSRTTAHLTQQLDLRLQTLVRDFGEGKAYLAIQGGRAAIDTIESIVDTHEIDCLYDRVPGILHASLTNVRDERADLQAEVELASKLGIDADFLENTPVFGLPGIRYPQQARFQPLAYLGALAELVDGEGCEVFEQSEVTEFDEVGLRVRCGEHWITCGNVVIATHVPLQGRNGFISALAFQSKLYPYTSYAIEAEVPTGTLPDALYWDTSDPYYYLRITPGMTTDHLIFGGEDHKTGQADNTSERFTRLEQVLLKHVPTARMRRRWSGQVIETNDGLPYIGMMGSRQFVATGFSGNGMTLGTLGGMMAHDAIVGQSNPWAELFAPGRVQLRGGTWDYVRENLDPPYYLIKDRLTPVEGTSVEEVHCGEGKILKLAGQTVACSRDAQGEAHSVSAVCTHMGCIVHWNDAEQTWDCACHGSRFTPEGKVIGGPAETPLKTIELPQHQLRS